MNDTLEYIAKKFELNLNQKSPINIEKINRTIMAQTLHELGLNKGVEVGVAQGDHSLILCKNMPNIELYCVDPWKPYDGYMEYRNRIVRYGQEAKSKLDPYNVHYMETFSMEAVKEFPLGSLDFVYIDGAHDFKNVADDICEWSKRVKIGGIVYGHDFKRRNRPEDKATIHVKDVVQAYVYAHGVSPWFVLGIKSNHKDGMYREGVQSWMFVRQEKDRINLL